MIYIGRAGGLELADGRTSQGTYGMWTGQYSAGHDVAYIPVKTRTIRHDVS